MKKFIFSLIVLLLLGFTFITYVRFFTGSDEDYWLCQNNQWIKHGNPAGNPPTTGCNDVNGENFKVKPEINNETGKTIPIVSEQSEEEQIKAALIDAFKTKFNTSENKFNIRITKVLGNFAEGGIDFVDELGGGMWFAAKTNKGWELAYDGNGIITCDVVTKYNFPKEMIPGCIDTENNNEYIER